MKKLLLLVMAIAFIGSVKAQSELTFGPKVGLNVTNVTHSDGDNKLSINAGVFAAYRLNDWLGIQTELLYSRQGWRDKVDIDGDDNVKAHFRVNYLNIPVLARFYVWEGLSVDLGPQIGIGLNAKQKYKYNGSTVKDKIHDLNTIEFSFDMGLSYEFDYGLILSARYNLGLSNVFGKDTFGDDNKNHVFQVSLGYRLNW